MSRSQKVNEPETMSTASAYLYKEQAECVRRCTSIWWNISIAA